MKTKFFRMSWKDKLVLGGGYFLLGLFVLLIIIPLVFVVVGSFMDPNELHSNGISFNISKWSLGGRRIIKEKNMIWRGFLNSLIYSTVFAVISVSITLLAAYPLSKKDFVGRRILNIFFIITMFFGGGLVPTYLLVSNLNMIDTIWALVLPGAVNVWNIILVRTYYQSVPKELREASAVDGASEITHFFKILLPVCKPIICVIFLYQFVGMWNSYFDAMIYLNDAAKQPLQLVLRSILIQNQPESGMISDMQSTAARAQLAELLKYATIIVSSLPLLVMYPFFQKYFNKGILVGSIKG